MWLTNRLVSDINPSVDEFFPHSISTISFDASFCLLSLEFLSLQIAHDASASTVQHIPHSLDFQFDFFESACKLNPCSTLECKLGVEEAKTCNF